MIKAHITPDELKQALRSHPDQFNMATWTSGSPCDTSYCIAGWVLTLAGYKLTVAADDLPGNEAIPDVAMRILGISDDALFYEGLWPGLFQNELFGPEETPEQKIERACAAIDYFMAKEV